LNDSANVLVYSLIVAQALRQLTSSAHFHWWVGGFAVETNQVTTVLACDETGRASAWVKNYGGPEGTGLAQLWHKRDGQEDLIAIKAVAEYGLRKETT